MLGRRRRSDVGGAFEHIANAARIPSRRAEYRRPTTAVAAAVGDVVQLLRDSPQRAKAPVAQKLFANACLPCTEAV